MVGEVDDFALTRSVDCGMRLLVDETIEPFGKPVIATRLFERAVHSLLNYGPMALVGDDEAMQIKLRSILHRRAVDLGDQTTRGGERRSVEPHLVSDGDRDGTEFGAVSKFI